MDAEQRARLDSGLAVLDGVEGDQWLWVPVPDLRALLVDYDAQAARLADLEATLATAQLRIGELFDLRAAAEQERDAQAARLAAVEQAIADNQWMHESHGVTRANDLRPRGYCTGCGDKHPCDPISLLEDLEAALKGAPNAD